MCVYIYIYRERERDTHTYMCIYVYTHMHIVVYGNIVRQREMERLRSMKTDVLRERERAACDNHVMKCDVS